jgi:group I intron endonuclease
MGSPCYIHRAIAKYGGKAFSLQVLAETSSKNDANEKESLFIAQFNTVAPHGYNLTLGGESVEMSPKTRKRISETLLGRQHTEKARKKMSQAHVGLSPSEETRTRIAKALSGRSLSKETRMKMSESHLKRGKACHIKTV